MPLHRIVALGDSVSRGTGTATHSYPTLVAQHASDAVGYRVILSNLSVNGWTSWSLRAEIHNHVPTKWALARCQAVLITIGANDMLSLDAAYRVSPWQPPHAWLLDRSLDSVGKALTAIRNQAPGAIIIATNYWNIFRDGDAEPNVEAKTWSRGITAEFNTGLTQHVADVGGHLVDLVPVFRPSPNANPVALLDNDGEHPNQAGHDAIAHAITPVLLDACGIPIPPSDPHSQSGRDDHSDSDSKNDQGSKNDRGKPNRPVTDQPIVDQPLADQPAADDEAE